MAVPQVTTGFGDTTSPTIRKYISREWVNVANPDFGKTQAQMLDQFNAQQAAGQAAADKKIANGDRGAVPASMLTGGAQSGFGAQNSIDAANAAMQAYQLDPTLANAQALHTAFTPVNTPMERRGLTAKRDPALDAMRQQMIPILGDAQQRHPSLVNSGFGVGDALFWAAVAAMSAGVGSGIGAAAGSSALGGAVGGGLSGAANTARTGESMGSGLLKGAVLGGVGGAATDYANTGNAFSSTAPASNSGLAGVTMPESSTILDNIAANATGNITPEAGGLAWGTNVVSPAAATSLGMAPSMADSVNTMNMAPAISAANRTAPSLFTSLNNAWNNVPEGVTDPLMKLIKGSPQSPQTQQPQYPTLGFTGSNLGQFAASSPSLLQSMGGGNGLNSDYDYTGGGGEKFGNLKYGVSPV